LVRPAAFFGFLLLAFYYVAQPPFLAASAEGHYLWIDRNAVEAAAMLEVSNSPSRQAVRKGMGVKVNDGVAHSRARR